MLRAFIQNIRAFFLIGLPIRELHWLEAVPFVEPPGTCVCLERIEANRLCDTRQGMPQQLAAQAQVDRIGSNIELVNPKQRPIDACCNKRRHLTPSFRNGDGCTWYQVYLDPMPNLCIAVRQWRVGKEGRT